jgi:preprotein translocase subunit SecB
MKAAQIELTNYFVSDLQFTANHCFDAQKPSNVTVEDLQVTNQATPKADELRNWQITLRIALNVPADRNVPYSFLVEMIGFIHVADSVKEESIERLVRINGASMIFSAAREIVRAVTSRGPFQPLLLPTVTFWEAKPQAPSEVKPAYDSPGGEASAQPVP